MEIISDQIENNSLLALDEGTLLDLLEEIHHYGANKLPLPEGMLVEDPVEKPKENLFASDVAIASRMVQLKKDITMTTPESLEQVADLIKKHFKDTGYRTPTVQVDLYKAMQIGTTKEHLPDSFEFMIGKNEYILMVRTNSRKDVLVLAVEPPGLQIPIAYHQPS